MPYPLSLARRLETQQDRLWYRSRRGASRIRFDGSGRAVGTGCFSVIWATKADWRIWMTLRSFDDIRKRWRCQAGATDEKG
ncbi:hypothetical protein [Altericista sp. CCNU0014]|uniref:hypothetical protein n=1 Tax=Altericista sp. CCNU0014 TaxID=3082949 RepID=UPI00384BE751